MTNFHLFGSHEIGVEIEDPFGYDQRNLLLGELDAQLEVATSITPPPEGG